MRTRQSLEAAFQAYWPPPKPPSKAIALTSVNREPVDITGLGTPHGWGPWSAPQSGVVCRVSLGDRSSIQWHNQSSDARKVEAWYGTSHWILDLEPGQMRDITAAGEGTGRWTVRQMRCRCALQHGQRHTLRVRFYMEIQSMLDDIT